MSDQRSVEVVDRGDRQLQHHRLIVGERIELHGDAIAQQTLGRFLLGTVDVDFGLDDRDQPGGEDLLGHLELLVDDRVDASAVGKLHHRTHLRAEHAEADRTLAQLTQARDRVHDLSAVRDIGKALVDLQEWHDVLGRPQVVSGAGALDLAVHRLLEQNRSEHAIAGERR